VRRYLMLGSLPLTILPGMQLGADRPQSADWFGTPRRLIWLELKWRECTRRPRSRPGVDRPDE
jgi:hypothetical protein